MSQQSLAERPKSQLLRFTERAFELAKRAVPRYTSKYSKHTYTMRQHVVLLCLKIKKTTTYRALIDELIEMPRIRDAINLESIPTPSTLCKAFGRLEMAIWRVMLTLSLPTVPRKRIAGIDASGFERAHASTHYTKRTNLKIQQLKTTLLVDTASKAVLDIHITTTRTHDTKIAPQVVKRNAGTITVLLGDKGYDDQNLRSVARDNGIRPLIKHREFTPLHEAWNARLDGDLYHQRNANETVNAAIKQKFGAFVRSQVWWKQFRELVIKSIVHNIETTLS